MQLPRRQTDTRIRKTLSVSKRQSQMMSDRKVVTKRQNSDATEMISERATSQETAFAEKRTAYSSTASEHRTDGSSSPVARGSIYGLSSKMSYLDPTEEMNKRWLKVIQKQVPTIDLLDISAEVYPFNSQKRQFAPEYSHSAYIAMLKQEYAIGDYVTKKNCSLKMTDYTRQQMVMLIEDLCALKQYKVETLYLAVSIADRYLVNLAVKGSPAPCLITLAVISVLMAAKLE